jgi:flavin-dependent dehydrogenase
MKRVTIAGGGPAGASAAIAAIAAGADAVVYEPSRLPRHKVCGEFLSAGIVPVLERLGVWREFQAAGPAPVRRMELTFGVKQKMALLPDTAWALSRFAFDDLLLAHARRQGATVRRERAPAATDVVAYGRRTTEPRGSRLFGFKAHFTGPANDAVELFFFDGCYVGLNAVEGGATNICGIAPESTLQRFNFRMDELLEGSPALRARVAPLTRAMPWLTTGPLVFGNRMDATPGYSCGDALSFVDPFTGSGLLAACATGLLAGSAAARGSPAAEYMRDCRRTLARPSGVSSAFRSLVANGWAERLVGVVPGAWLYRLTRPRMTM